MHTTLFNLRRLGTSAPTLILLLALASACSTDPTGAGLPPFDIATATGTYSLWLTPSLPRASQTPPWDSITVTLGAAMHWSGRSSWRVIASGPVSLRGDTLVLGDVPFTGYFMVPIKVYGFRGNAAAPTASWTGADCRSIEDECPAEHGFARLQQR